MTEQDEYQLRRWNKETAQYPKKIESKRFYAQWCDEESYALIDKEQGFQIATVQNVDIKNIVDLLNEQQEELEGLREHNKRLKETLIKQNEIIHHASFDEIQQIRELKLE